MKKQLKRLLSCLVLCAVLTGSLTVSAGAAGFSDVPANHWAAKDIQRCVELGLFQGESATRFGLGHEMTRAAFTVVLCRFFGWETAKPTQPIYTDVPVNTWYAGAVQAAYEHGAVTEQRAEFRPNAPITREALAVMLVRALGYSTIAGLAQDLPLPFGDVTTNAGYITMVRDFGLMNGVSAASFQPGGSAPRELVAVTLMRLYDKLHRAEPGRVGILTPGEPLPDLTSYEAIGVNCLRLVTSGGAKLNQTAAPNAAAALRDAARQAGVKALLYVEGGPTAMNGSPSEAAAVIAQAVKDGGYDGLLLDIPGLRSAKESALVKLAAALRSRLEGKALYLTVEAPSRQEPQYDGYDYAALGKSADKLILRVASCEKVSGQHPAAPVEPLEELYYALAQLQGKVDNSKLSILLTTVPSAWINGKKGNVPNQESLAALMKAGTLERHYSGRYACAYLAGTDEQKSALMIWYLDQQAIDARARFAMLFDVDQLVMADARIQPLEILPAQ